MRAIDMKIIHFLLLVLILILFSKLSVDAVILGAFAIYLYQTRTIIKEPGLT